MKFINHSLLTSVVVLVLFTSCTSIQSPPAVEQNKAEPLQINKPKLSPVLEKVLALKALPNLYKDKAAQQSNSLAPQVMTEFKRGLALIKEDAYEQARTVLLSLSERVPQLSGVWVQLAHISQQQAELKTNHNSQDTLVKASKYLANAISANPVNYMAHNQMALVLRKQGEFKRALYHYDMALKSWPAFPDAYRNRGILYDLYLGQKPLAMADYKIYQVLSAEPSRQLKGWIIDLDRQIKRAEKAQLTGVDL
jgi:tetratricopeptide (TPR) repeat protein